jgi:DNA-binding response OmpR family regulator
MKALIVEDGATSMLILKSILNLLGVGRIVQATTGSAAIQAMKEVRFDLVLSDYNLGPGKNGQQVLEEARVHGLIDASTVFFLISAETSREMVMGAMEYQPDTYLVKPFTPKDLSNRLMATMKVRQVFADIDIAIERKQYEKAIALCDRKINESPRHKVHALRLKAEARLELKQFAEAAEEYRRILSIKELPWALLGIGKALFLGNQISDAEEHFEAVIKSSPDAVAAYDWLAKLQESEGHSGMAQRTLEQAISISPKAILRQVELGGLAARNASWQISEEAYRAAVSLSHDSCYNTPDNYFGLVSALKMKLDDTRSKESLETLTEATNVLEQVRAEYKGDASVNLKATICESECHALSGKDQTAGEKIVEAASIYRNFGSADKEAHCNPLIRGLMNSECHERAIEIVEDLDDDRIVDEELLAQVRSRASQIKKDRSEELNKQGIAIYESGNIDDAYQFFRKAADMDEANSSVLLNAIQTCLELVQQDRRPSADWSAKCTGFFERIGEVNSESHHFERFSTLKQSFQELT